MAGGHLSPATTTIRPSPCQRVGSNIVLRLVPRPRTELAVLLVDDDDDDDDDGHVFSAQEAAHHLYFHILVARPPLPPPARPLSVIAPRPAAFRTSPLDILLARPIYQRHTPLGCPPHRSQTRPAPRSWSPRTPPASAHPSAKRFSLESPSVSSSRDASASKENRRRSMFAGPASDPGIDPVLTLAEKHAPLLQFIAQKEARCLELRSQLATQEAELLALKQAWERIVRRDFGKTSSSPATPLQPPAAISTPAAGGHGLDGILDNVPASFSRILALAPPPQSPALAPERAPSLATRPSPFAKRQQHTHAPSASASTTATSASASTGSTRLSQSSASSAEPDADDETATLTAKTGEQVSGDAPRAAGAHERVLRRRSREVPKERKAPGLNPSPREENDRRVGALPPPASVPGLGSLAAMGLNANVAAAAEGWLGKRITEGSKTLSKSQKRASVLFADVSQSLLAAFSPSPSETPASWLQSPSMSPSPAMERTGPSLLDEDEEVLAAPALKPLQPSPTPTPRPASTAPVRDESFDDDWNW
ncbi:hypothetical protein K488DRAFT_85718 [Vararia minispora EC-137]|uniref:Uncharacterized protein n=1 Tax=Vararia minispora EC-137 TaxID=1314806 RepID=A0ACB8QLZ0_9AGAM|nr:hypothetical protein K488DRAFT_85718 [Vararia minispora EC-137]